MRYIIIGSGVAGVEAAMSIRKYDEEGDITIIDKDKYLFYYRPRLVEHLSGNLETEKMIAYKKDIYEQKNINIISDTEIIKIDAKNQKIIDSENKSYEYDKLLIATGAKPFIPPVKGIDKEGVFCFRNIDDSDNIQKYCTENKGHFEVIGGGLLGIETANSIKELGCSVTVIEYFDRILPRQLDKEASDILEKKLLEKGINFKLNCSVESIEGNKKAEKIVLKSGEIIEVNGVIFSTGVRADIDLVKNTEIKINKGIIVNDKMETNIKNIYAAGDVAEHEGLLYGLWIPAKEQGKTAGMNMAKQENNFEHIPIEARLKVTGITLFSAGDFEKKCDTVKTYKDENVFRKFFINENKLEAVIIIGDNKAAIASGKVIEGKAGLDTIKEYM